MHRHIPDRSISDMLGRENALFLQRNPESKRLAEKAAPHWLKGVPMHWMVDWGTPFPLFVAEAQGASLTDADGHDQGGPFGLSAGAHAKAGAGVTWRDTTASNNQVQTVRHAKFYDIELSVDAKLWLNMPTSFMRCSALSGASESEQFPATTVVTPCESAGFA